MPWDHTKKKTTKYKEQNPEKVKLYQEQINGIPLENIAYIDETGIDTYYFENMAMLQKVRKYVPKSVEKNTNEWVS